MLRSFSERVECSISNHAEMFQPEPEITSSKCENISRTQNTSNSTSFFKGFSGLVELEFDSTARYFPFKDWKRNWNWKVRKKVSSFECFVWTRTRQFREPTREFSAELSNIFPLQSEQMCKIKTKSNKNNFSSSFASGHVKCSSEDPDFFALDVQNLSPLTPKIFENDSFFEENIFLLRLFILTGRLQYWHPCWKLSREIFEILFKMRKTISKIKSFEVKTTFVNCSSIKVDRFSITLPEVFGSNSK